MFSWFIIRALSTSPIEVSSEEIDSYLTNGKISIVLLTNTGCPYTPLFTEAFNLAPNFFPQVNFLKVDCLTTGANYCSEAWASDKNNVAGKVFVTPKFYVYNNSKEINTGTSNSVLSTYTRNGDITGYINVLSDFSISPILLPVRSLDSNNMNSFILTTGYKLLYMYNSKDANSTMKLNDVVNAYNNYARNMFNGLLGILDCADYPLECKRWGGSESSEYTFLIVDKKLARTTLDISGITFKRPYAGQDPYQVDDIYAENGLNLYDVIEKGITIVDASETSGYPAPVTSSTTSVSDDGSVIVSIPKLPLTPTETIQELELENRNYLEIIKEYKEIDSTKADLSSEEVGSYENSIWAKVQNVQLSNNACNVGQLQDKDRESAVKILNFYRALVGIPGDRNVTNLANATTRPAESFAATTVYNRQTLSHEISTWNDCFSDFSKFGGWSEEKNASYHDLAASKGQLSIGSRSIYEAVSRFLIDAGSDNTLVGHRRNLLSPKIKSVQMGFHGVDSNFPTYLPITVIRTLSLDGQESVWDYSRGPRFYAFPNPGPSPISLINKRWSIVCKELVSATDTDDLWISVTRDDGYVLEIEKITLYTSTDETVVPDKQSLIFEITDEALANCLASRSYLVRILIKSTKKLIQYRTYLYNFDTQEVINTVDLNDVYTTTSNFDIDAAKDKSIWNITNIDIGNISLENVNKSISIIGTGVQGTITVPPGKKVHINDPSAIALNVHIEHSTSSTGYFTSSGVPKKVTIVDTDRGNGVGNTTTALFAISNVNPYVVECDFNVTETETNKFYFGYAYIGGTLFYMRTSSSEVYRVGNVGSDVAPSDMKHTSSFANGIIDLSWVSTGKKTIEIYFNFAERVDYKIKPQNLPSGIRNYIFILYSSMSQPLYLYDYSGSSSKYPKLGTKIGKFHLKTSNSLYSSAALTLILTDATSYISTEHPHNCSLASLEIDDGTINKFFINTESSSFDYYTYSNEPPTYIREIKYPSSMSTQFEKRIKADSGFTIPADSDVSAGSSTPVATPTPAADGSLIIDESTTNAVITTQSDKTIIVSKQNDNINDVILDIQGSGAVEIQDIDNVYLSVSSGSNVSVTNPKMLMVTTPGATLEKLSLIQSCTVIGDSLKVGTIEMNAGLEGTFAGLTADVLNVYGSSSDVKLSGLSIRKTLDLSSTAILEGCNVESGVDILLRNSASIIQTARIDQGFYPKSIQVPSNVRSILSDVSNISNLYEEECLYSKSVYSGLSHCVTTSCDSPYTWYASAGDDVLASSLSCDGSSETDQSTPESGSSGKGKSISKGAVTAIVIAAIAVVVSGAFGGFYYIQKSRKVSIMDDRDSNPGSV